MNYRCRWFSFLEPAIAILSLVISLFVTAFPIGAFTGLLPTGTETTKAVLLHIKRLFVP